MSKPFNRILRFTRMRLNLRETVLKICAGLRILLDWHRVCRLLGKTQSVSVASGVGSVTDVSSGETIAVPVTA